MRQRGPATQAKSMCAQLVFRTTAGDPLLTLRREETFSISLAGTDSFARYGLAVQHQAGLLLHQKAAGCRNVDRMRSIRGPQFEQNILHVCLYGCLRNRKVQSDYLV